MAIRRMQETLDIIPKLQDENAALSRELAELREKQNSTSVAKESSTSAMLKLLESDLLGEGGITGAYPGFEKGGCLRTVVVSIYARFFFRDLAH